MVDFTGGTWRSLIDGQEVSAIPDSGGTHQWNYDEGSGDTFADSIATLDGTLVNNPSWASDAGAGGSYVVLNGTDQYGDLGSESRTEFTHFTENGVGTWAKWIKPANTTDRMSVAVSTSDSAFVGTELRVDSGEVQWRCYTGDGNFPWVSDGGSYSADDWIFVAGTADGSDAFTYLAEPPDYDVLQVGSDEINTGELTSQDFDNNVEIGRSANDGSNHFEGGIGLDFTDNSSRTQSNLQEWVDDTKGFYE